MVEDENDAALAIWTALIWSVHLRGEPYHFSRPAARATQGHFCHGLKATLKHTWVQVRGHRCPHPLWEMAKSSGVMLSDHRTSPLEAYLWYFSFNLGILFVLCLSPWVGWEIRGEDFCSDSSCLLQNVLSSHLLRACVWKLRSQGTLCLLLPGTFSRAQRFYTRHCSPRVEDQWAKGISMSVVGTAPISNIYLAFKYYFISHATNQKIKEHSSAPMTPGYSVFVVSPLIFLPPPLQLFFLFIIFPQLHPWKIPVTSRLRNLETEW